MTEAFTRRRCREDFPKVIKEKEHYLLFPINTLLLLLLQHANFNTKYAAAAAAAGYMLLMPLTPSVRLRPSSFSKHSQPHTHTHMNTRSKSLFRVGHTNRGTLSVALAPLKRINNFYPRKNSLETLQRLSDALEGR